MKRTIMLVAAVLAALAVVFFGGGSSDGTPAGARDREAGAESSARSLAPRRPALAAADASRPRPALADGPEAARGAFDEPATELDAALEQADLIVESVRDQAAPPPSAAERRRIRDRAVTAYFALAPELAATARKRRWADMRDRLRRMDRTSSTND